MPCAKSPISPEELSLPRCSVLPPTVQRHIVRHSWEGVANGLEGPEVLPHIPRRAGQPPPPRAKSAWPAVLTEAGSPLASPLHSPPPQISASLFVGGSQPHGHEFLQGRALICPLLGPPSALSVHLSVYVHIYACTYCVCIWVPNEVDEPNPNDSEFPPL